MRARLMIALICLCPALVFANTLDNDTIKKIHDQLQKTFIAKCKYDVQGATDSTCSCLADKAQMMLDDAALSQCTNDESGTGCITHLVSTATNTALDKENVNLCMRDTGSQPVPVAPVMQPPELMSADSNIALSNPSSNQSQEDELSTASVDTSAQPSYETINSGDEESLG